MGQGQSHNGNVNVASAVPVADKGSAVAQKRDLARGRRSQEVLGDLEKKAEEGSTAGKDESKYKEG